MKKSNFLLGAAAALAMGAAFTSCSDDDIKGIDNGKAEADITRYLSVTISAPQGTLRSRAGEGDFQAATAGENYIHDLYFVFFDANGDNIDFHELHFDNNLNDTDGENKKGGVFDPAGDDQTPGATTGNIGKVYTTVVPVEMTTGQNMPSYVMAFINPVTPAEILHASMSDIDNLKRQWVQNTDTHFPMSNSVYYGTNPITGETNVRMVATPVTTAQLFDDPAKAKDATGGQIVEIYVERYAAKINLTLAPDAIENCDDVEGYNLTFVPEYWRPNAIDENINVIKHFAIHSATLNTDTPTFGQLNDRLVVEGGDKTNPWWNDADNYRSYWGCSPSYWTMEYPKVSDNVSDGDKNYDLHYFNYNEIVASKIGENATSASIKWVTEDEATAENPAGFQVPFYARETTTSADVWQNAKDYNPMASLASAVIIGRYKVTKDDGTALPDNSTFYLYGKNGDEWILYETEAAAKTAMAVNQSIVLDATSHEPIRDAAAFTLAHPSKEVRDAAKATVAGRFVALQLPANATGYVYYDVTTQTYKPVAGNITEVNAALLTAGYARMYGTGLAYFNIPIRHLNYQDQTGDINVANYNFKVQPAGAFGIVRNHVYTININKISGLATALRDAEQPIVPPMDEQTYYIKARLNVLNWRIVPTQNVEL